ncbi:aminopeptidase NDAI_0A03130 [Naumovozyma dairenensis CBS 421]|uniref:Aminopeptidase P N-terminal domain-containing protein n=1 Tax=Naumovozyma dairenensis (strain ATCC 10597 / BCRC 20456 / CBS 421 / NBRC 0211 / NRRL Y-12639) TaxID=1071378 RepID=G0W3T2_NAUDC|nr:hypothetical protein NDAI_0A03130 [Naumovozyma dairenensis CBS 421]CCD22470.1 hypothetical protein NDAI_0A03130 [Naumovozyma dairenensis CBS 421]
MMQSFKSLRPSSIAPRLIPSLISKRNKFTSRLRSPIQAGQPLHETRPNLLKPGELTPGITALEYFQRRHDLMGRLPLNSCLILQSNQVKYASGAVFYPFQQDNDFYYLTGWNEPDSIMILERTRKDETIFHMITPPKDAFAEQWEGFRTGEKGVKDIFNADGSCSNSIAEWPSYLEKILKRNDTVYFDKQMIKNSSHNPAHHKQICTVLQINNKLDRLKTDAREIIAEMRKIKSDAELRVMRRAGQISGRSYNQAFGRRFRNERTLHSFLEYKFVSGGCDKSAYIPVVASGSNSLCIHYTSNNDVMYDDEMVLVDASGALGGYCSDISRTWPVNGEFTEPQKDLYSAVLNVQRKCIQLCKASNNYSLQDIHNKSMEYMKEELLNLGIPNAGNWEVDKLYPHYIGHNLGLDVHDVPQVSRFEPLKPGQVITIEPGLYIPNDTQFPDYFRNVGIRIEDDIAIHENSFTNLTIEAVKELPDLESVMTGGSMTKMDEDVISPLDL